MASASGAFSANGGFNQSGGPYYLVVSSINGQVFNYTAGSGSGGATTVGTFTAVSSITTNISTAFGNATAAGSVIRDMGKTVVSSGITFRKFALTGALSLDTFGVTDLPNATYSTGYLQVAREGTPTAYAKIARM
jgi:hypothetical protein